MKQGYEVYAYYLGRYQAMESSQYNINLDIAAPIAVGSATLQKVPATTYELFAGNTFPCLNYEGTLGLCCDLLT